MKNEEVTPGTILASAFAPVTVLALAGAFVLWFGVGWSQEATTADARAVRARGESAETARRIAELRANKSRIDAAWLELSAGTLRVAATATTPGAPAPAGGGMMPPNGGNRGVSVGEAPLNRGAAAASGLVNPLRARDLPEALQALGEADLVILAQPANGDRRFRRWVVGTDRVEFGRLLPLLASVESRFPLALVEEADFTLPAGGTPFGTEPRALESRMLLRLPVYDAGARQAELRERQRRGPAAGPARPGGASPGNSPATPRPAA